jgi:hypothetical protein
VIIKLLRNGLKNQADLFKLTSNPNFFVEISLNPILFHMSILVGFRIDEFMKIYRNLYIWTLPYDRNQNKIAQIKSPSKVQVTQDHINVRYTLCKC